MRMRWQRPTFAARPLVVDGALALALTAVSLPMLWMVEAHDALLPRYPGPTAATVAVSLGLTLPLLWRRRSPTGVVLAIGVATVGAAAMSVPHPGLSVVLAVYTVAADAPRRRAWAALAAFSALVLVALVLADGLRHIGTNILVLGTAWLLGDWRRLHRVRTAELERRTAALERAREQRARLAVSEERQRIAGELRDVLAHGVSAMVTQAQAAGRTIATDAGRATAALLAVEQTGRAGLVELRRLVALLRESEPAADQEGHAPEAGGAAEQRPTGEQGLASERPASEQRPARVLATRLGRVRDLVTSWPVLGQDACLAALVLGVELSLQWLYRPAEFGLDAYAGPTLWTILVIVGMSGALVLRRRMPQVVLAASLVGATLAVQLEVPANLWGPLVALYTVAVHRPRRVSLAWLGATLCLAALLLGVHGQLGFLPGQVVVIGSAWLLGDRQRVRLEYASELEDRSARLEQARAREIVLAVAEERARIARELHDIVAHSVGVMVVQAGGARRLIDRDPERAARGVQQVVASGRDSLSRMRTVFRLLGDDRAFAPQPAVSDLPDLVDDFGQAGLTVTFEQRGGPRVLSAGVELSAYRIVQESLTNVLKHAGPVRASVRLVYGDDSLLVEVSDDGPGPGPGSVADTGGGHGIVGMRERAALVGGRLEVGARAGGGFLVSATLPVDGPVGAVAAIADPAAEPAAATP